MSNTKTISVDPIVRAIHALRAVAESPVCAATDGYRMDALTAAHGLEDAIRGVVVTLEAEPQKAVA